VDGEDATVAATNNIDAGTYVAQAVSEAALAVDLFLSGPDVCGSGQTSPRPSPLETELARGSPPRPRIQPCRLLMAECLTQWPHYRFRRVWRSGSVFLCRRPSSMGHQGCAGLERRSTLRCCGAVSALLPSRVRQTPPNGLIVFSCRNWEWRHHHPMSTLRRCVSTRRPSGRRY
jgi:hypothetical protein